jgi:hypothetical protein
LKNEKKRGNLIKLMHVTTARQNSKNVYPKNMKKISKNSSASCNHLIPTSHGKPHNLFLEEEMRVGRGGGCGRGVFVL